MLEKNAIDKTILLLPTWHSELNFRKTIQPNIHKFIKNCSVYKEMIDDYMCPCVKLNFKRKIRENQWKFDKFTHEFEIHWLDGILFQVVHEQVSTNTLSTFFLYNLIPIKTHKIIEIIYLNNSLRQDCMLIQNRGHEELNHVIHV